MKVQFNSSYKTYILAKAVLLGELYLIDPFRSQMNVVPNIVNGDINSLVRKSNPETNIECYKYLNDL